MAKEREKFQLEKEAIPEARRYKLGVLERLDNILDEQGKLYSIMGLGNIFANNVMLFRVQAAIIKLYNNLKPKLKKKELNILERLDDYKNKNSSDPLPLDYLNECVDILIKVIERMGITKVEVEKEDGRHLFKRA